MLRKPHFLILLLAVLMAFVGCSDDPTAPRGETASIIKGTMSTDQPAFAYVVERANHPENPRPGPFILQGSNLHYDDSFGTLVVDLTVTHAGVDVYYEPVSITFLDLLPEGVTVFDPPGGEPTFEFEFTNDDAMWTPGEKSLPLTVAFVVEPETSISFTAEIGIGFGPDSGLISGVVWEDLNGNGVREENENGVGGVPVILIDGNIDPRLPIAHPRAITGPEGNYSFPGLLAGTYTVKVEPQPFITQVTPAERHVLLTETSGGVGTFEGADFGVVIVPIEQNILEADADATVRADVSSRMNDNHGADPFLGVGTTRSSPDPVDAIRGLVRFDLAGVSRPVISAHLELTICAFRDGYDQTYQLDLNPIVASGPRTPWIEGNGSEVTPLPEGVAWVDAAHGVAWIGQGDGGDLNNQTQPDFDPTPAASATIVQGDHAAGDVIRWDITDLVNRWSSGEMPNNGVVIRDVQTQGGFRQLWFGARDGLLRGYTDSRVQAGPRLVLVFE